MASRSAVALSSAAALFCVVLGLRSTFVQVASPTIPSQLLRGSNLARESPLPVAQAHECSSAATAVAAAALISVAVAAASRRRGSAVAPVAQSTTTVVLAGGIVNPCVREGMSARQPSVALKSMNSCYNLYFGNKKGFNYSDRARRNLRNRAYNIFMKNMYKKAMKRVLTYCIDLEFGDDTPASLDAVWGDVKDLLDEACEIVDEVCVQGVIHRNTAARRKDRMCRAILRGSIVKGLIKKPEDRFEPAYKTLKYEMPVCTLTREPRPWQLPGWKSPWMLKREYKKWTNSKQEEEA